MRALFILFAISLFQFGCMKKPENNYLSISKGDIQLNCFSDNDDQACYKIFHKDICVIDTSRLGFYFNDINTTELNWTLVDSKMKEFSEKWKMPWGEKRIVENDYSELITVWKSIDSGIEMHIIFRVFKDGVGFRYYFPESENITEVLIFDEYSEFKLTDNHQCWWQPGDWDIYEHLYSNTRFNKINALKYRGANLAQSYIPENAVNTPVTMKTDNGLYLSFHEANLSNYSGMTLKIIPEKLKMTSKLVGSENHKYKVKRKLPFETPWRTIQISENAGGLIESDLIVNLNEVSKIEDISWFEPTKYIGIWWEMHLGKSSWDYSSGKHGATTAHAKELIDFASENNINAILVEGWNTGWEKWYGTHNRENIFDFVTSYPDYNLDEVVKYGRSKNVDLIMHHETSAAISTYEKQMDNAFSLMQKHNIHTVKTGYVGKIIPEGEYHHGQFMVNHYRKVLETAAKYQIAVNAHEPIKATGIRRTWPNAISREGLRGQEFNAWSEDGGNPPNHLCNVAFTRMLAGPIDFTPGIFNIKLEPYKKNNQISTTISHQLALYVVIYSPVQMAADLIEYYKTNPAFQFIRDVGVDWEQTIVLNGEIGEFVTIAREERKTGNWFIGGITNEMSRTMKIKFDFLPNNIEFDAILYCDTENSHWDNNPTDYKIEEFVANKSTKRVIHLAEGGGFAISLINDSLQNDR